MKKACIISAVLLAVFFLMPAAAQEYEDIIGVMHEINMAIDGLNKAFKRLNRAFNKM
jgi:hypothetical protein